MCDDGERIKCKSVDIWLTQSVKDSSSGRGGYTNRWQRPTMLACAARATRARHIDRMGFEHAMGGGKCECVRDQIV